MKMSSGTISERDPDGRTVKGVKYFPSIWLKNPKNSPDSKAKSGFLQIRPSPYIQELQWSDQHPFEQKSIKVHIESFLNISFMELILFTSRGHRD